MKIAVDLYRVDSSLFSGEFYEVFDSLMLLSSSSYGFDVQIFLPKVTL